MDLALNYKLIKNYKSNSQKARILTEDWVIWKEIFYVGDKNMDQVVNKLIIELLSYPLFLIFVIIGILGLIYAIIKNINKVIKNNRIRKKSTNDYSKNIICPKCGGNLVERTGEYGKFYGCSNYPKCKYTKKNISWLRKSIKLILYDILLY